MSIIEHQQQQLKTVFFVPCLHSNIINNNSNINIINNLSSQSVGDTPALPPHNSDKNICPPSLGTLARKPLPPCLHLTLWLVYWFISLLWVLFWFYERHFTSQLSVLREGWITLRWGHWLEDLWTAAKYPQIPTTWSHIFGDDDDIDHCFLRAATKYPQMPTHQICACG